jgi:hypothetical protein
MINKKQIFGSIAFLIIALIAIPSAKYLYEIMSFYPQAIKDSKVIDSLSTKFKIPEQLSLIVSKIEKTNKKQPKRFTKTFWSMDSADSTKFVQKDSALENGIEFAFVEEKIAKDIWERYHNQVSQLKYFLFLKNLDFDDKYSVYYDVCILNFQNQFDVVKFMETSAPNYDIDNLHVIAKLKDWYKMHEFVLCVIDEDRIEAKFIELPKDIKSFANDAYEFCPDVIEQGYGDMDKMVNDIRHNSYFWLWWD